jgi:hypothetical protein
LTYRDDHEAAIARAEALEREAAELREKNQALERENEVLAAERERLAEQVAEPKRALARVAGEPPEVREAALAPQDPGRLVSSALHAHTGLAVAGAAAPMLILPALAALAGSGVLAVIALPAGLIASLALLPFFNALDEQRERSLLRELPLPLDVAAYLELLDRPQPRMKELRVAVELESVPDPQAGNLMIRAVTTTMPDADARLDGQTLVITSHPIRARAGRHPDNVRLHRWFRRLIAHALLPIARAHAIRRVTVA